MSDGASGNEDDGITVRKNDTSDSTKDYWRNGAGNHPYHRHDTPCDNAPKSGFVYYEFGKIHCPENYEFCPDCDWAGTEVEPYAEPEADHSGGGGR